MGCPTLAPEFQPIGQINKFRQPPDSFTEHVQIAASNLIEDDGGGVGVWN